MKTIADGSDNVKKKTRTYIDSLELMGNWSMMHNGICEDQLLSPCAKLTFWVLVANSFETTMQEDASPAFGTFESVLSMAKQTALSPEYLTAGIRELGALGLISRTYQTGAAAHILLPSLDEKYPQQTRVADAPDTYAAFVKAGNYSRLSNAVLRDHELSWRAKLVFMLVVRRSNSGSRYPNGDPAFGCWPGVQGMATDLNTSHNTVDRGLCELAKRGIILRSSRGHRRSCHMIVLPLDAIYNSASSLAAANDVSF
jgi:hypothetical protein